MEIGISAFSLLAGSFFDFESGQYQIGNRCVRFILNLCTGQPRASDFTIFGVFRFVAVLFRCCFSAWMRTAILAGGIAVVRSGICSVFS